MSVIAVKGIFLFILIGTFLLERWLDLKNMRHSLPELPDELKDIYDEDEYRKSQLYKRENTRFAFITNSFSLFIMFSIILQLIKYNHLLFFQMLISLTKDNFH